MEIKEATRLRIEIEEERERYRLIRKALRERERKDKLHKEELAMSKEEKEKRCRKMWNEYMKHSEAKEYFAPPMYTALYEYFDLYSAIINPTSAVQIPIRIAMELKYRPEEDHTKYNSVLLEVEKRRKALLYNDAKYLYYCTMFRDGYAAIVNISQVSPMWERKWMKCQKDSNTDEMVYKEVFLIPNNEVKWIKLDDK